MTDKTTLYKKLAQIMGEIETVSKEGKNERFGYRFVTSDTILNLLRRKLAEKNICLWVSMAGVRQEVKANSDKMKVTIASFQFTFCCGDSGETMTANWEAEAEDTNDKGINKAATAAEKYWLLKTFMISTGDPEVDDADADFHGGQKETTRRRPAPRKLQTPDPRPYPPEKLVEKFGLGLATAQQGEGSDQVDPDHMKTVSLIWPSHGR